MLKHHSEYDEQHKVQFEVYIGDFNEFNDKFVSETLDEPFDEGADGWCYFDEEDSTIYLWVNNFHIPHVIHETNHAVMFVFDSCGINYNGENSEHFCLYSEYISNLFIKCLNT